MWGGGGKRGQTGAAGGRGFVCYCLELGSTMFLLFGLLNLVEFSPHPNF